MQQQPAGASSNGLTPSYPTPSTSATPYPYSYPPATPPVHRTPPPPSPQWRSGQRFYVSGSGAPQSVTHQHSFSRPPAPALPPRPSFNSSQPGPTSVCVCCLTANGPPAPVFQCVTCGTVNDSPDSMYGSEERPFAPVGLSAEEIALLEEELDYASHSAPPGEHENDTSHPEVVFLVRVRSAFSSVANLELSCRTADGTISLDSIHKLYGLVMKRPPVLAALRERIEGLLRRPGNKIHESDGGWCCVLLEAPVFHSNGSPEAVQRAWLVSRLIGLISHLPNHIHNSIVRFLSSPNYTKLLLEQKVDMVTAFISLRIGGSLHAAGGYELDWGIQAGSRVGALLFAGNQLSPRLRLASFYVTLIDTLGAVAIVHSFDIWESRSAQFSLCQYPFLLSLGVKIHLIAYDGRRQMEEKAQEALRSLIYRNEIIQPFLVLQVRRIHLVSDALRQISAHTGPELKKSLRIVFEGEEGVDAGGVRKEFFLVLCRQLFDPQFGMFSYAGDSTLCWFNPASHDQEEFFLVGAVLGLSIYNNVTLDVPLPLAVYKKLKLEPVGLADLAVFDPELARGLQALLDYEGGDVASVFCRTFVGEYEAWGEVQQVELVPGGAEKEVDETNRAEFVRLLVDFVLNRSIEHQFTPFATGFNQVVSGNAFSLVKGEEVELLVRGSLEPLDIDQLKAVTVYEGFSGEDDPTVVLFWEIFSSMDTKKQHQLLSFITGSDRIPATGTSALQLKLICMGNDCGRMPTSHTCFDTLCLYRYKDRKTMEDRLTTAMEESEGFGLK